MHTHLNCICINDSSNCPEMCCKMAFLGNATSATKHVDYQHITVCFPTQTTTFRCWGIDTYTGNTYNQYNTTQFGWTTEHLRRHALYVRYSSTITSCMHGTPCKIPCVI